jgi:microcystin-dependent protein
MDPFIGEIRLFGGNYAPPGWLLCDGSSASIQTYPALYSLIGVTYGGDGVATFGLPNLQGRVPIGIGQGPGLQNYPLGANGGTQLSTMTAANLPVHTHSISVSSAYVNTSTPGPTVTFGKLADPMRFYVNTNNPTTAIVNFSAQAVSTTGASNPHENMMPSMAMTYIICWEGLYPQFP